MSPFKPETQAVTASRLFLREIEQKIQARDDFAFETTLSGRGYLKLINRLKQNGWTVDLYYLALPSVDMALLRVAERFRHGGHNIPENVIRRRFPRSLHNLFNAYIAAVDHGRCFMNAGGEVMQVFESDASGVRINDEAAYCGLKEMAQS
ncbi:MAG: zeta toxin family protein [Asticcacaulis sp.]